MWQLLGVLFVVFVFVGCDNPAVTEATKIEKDKINIANKIIPKSGPSAPGSRFIKTYTMKESFETVKDAVKEALTDRGLVINNVAHISKMLQRTGKDLGKTGKIYQRAENIEFCSAVVSRKTMTANPHNITYCPYIISIYVLAKEPKKVYVSYRKLPRHSEKKSDSALQEVEKLLDGIAKEATE